MWVSVWSEDARCPGCQCAMTEVQDDSAWWAKSCGPLQTSRWLETLLSGVKSGTRRLFFPVCWSVVSTSLFSYLLVFQTVVAPGCVLLSAFEIRPAIFELHRGDTATIEILFSPTQIEQCTETMTMVCDNCQVKHFNLTGNFFAENMRKQGLKILMFVLRTGQAWSFFHWTSLHLPVNDALTYLVL